MNSDSTPWWSDEIKTEDRHEAVWSYVTALEESQAEIHERNLAWAWLYDRCLLMGLGGTLQWTPPKYQASGVVENVIESIVDTATSMIARHRPRATFITNGGDYKQRRKAKKLRKYIDGEFQRLEVYRRTPEVFRDACVFGTGALKIFGLHGKPHIERVIPDEIIVDEEACRAAEPREIFHRKFVDRWVLAQQYPDFRAEIARAQQSSPEYTSYRRCSMQQVVVIEGWRLPSAPGAGDGRHTIIIQGATLLDEPWTRDRFPFVFFRWRKRTTGWYGVGLCEQLASIQARINKLYRFIAHCQDMIAVPKVALHKADAKIQPQMTNRIGEILLHSGHKPEFWTPTAVGQEIYTHIEQLKADAYQLSGVSQLTASSQLPAGTRLDSSLAMQEYTNFETQRFSGPTQRYEECHLDIAREIIACAKELSASGTKLSTTYRGRKATERLDWSKVDLEEDSYSMTVTASSILSLSPAEREAKVKEYVAMGLLTDPAKIWDLLGTLDVDGEQALQSSPVEDIAAVIEQLEDEDAEFPVPQPFQDLDLGITEVNNAYLILRNEKADEDTLQRFRDWIELATHEVDKAKQASAAQQMAAQGPAPMGADPTLPPGPPAPAGPLPPELMAAAA